MKRIVLTAIAALLVAVPAVQAQKVNRAAIQAKIEKSDAEIADAKKGAKAATWINRGKAFYEAAAEPSKSLFVNMDAPMLKLAVGEPTSKSQAQVGDITYETWVYPYFIAYMKDNKVVAWKQTREVMKGAVDKAIEAYNKAYELDPKSADKAKEGLKQISDLCSQRGNVGIDTGEYVDAANAFAQAFKAQSGPAYGQADPSLLYYSGYLLTVDGSKNVESFVKASKYLKKALDMGYNDPEGAIYYYYFHSLYGQKANDPAFVGKSKEALLTGIEKYPKNERIIEGLMQLYTTEPGVGDPADLIALIDKAIAENPTNKDLWFGRARIFYTLKNFDESIASFKKVAELSPEEFEGNYFVGVIYAFKGENMQNELNDKPYSSEEVYNADLKAINETFRAALPWLEKAHKIKPEDENTVELLKTLCFRLRDEPGMQEKHDLYNGIWKKMKGE